MLLHLPHGHGADAVAAAMTEAMAGLPAALGRSLAQHPGSELAAHAQITLATDLDIYFCHPHSPWLPGSPEPARAPVGRAGGGPDRRRPAYWTDGRPGIPACPEATSIREALCPARPRRSTSR
jgi:hypothetical protein